MSYSYQPPQPHQAGYPPQYPPQGAYAPQQPQGWHQPPPQHYQGPPPAGPQFGYAPSQQHPPQHPHVAVNVHQQYAQPVQQGNAIGQPLFSPSQMGMSAASPSHQLDGSAQAKMANASGLSGLRDKWWLLLFGLHLLMLFVVEGVFGKSLMDDWNKGNTGSSLNLTEDGANVVGMLVVAAVIGSVFSAFWFKCMKWAQGKVVIMSVVGNVIFSLGVCILYFSIGLGYGTIPFIFWSVWLVVWVIWNRARIPLAEATLAAANKSVSESWGPIVVAYGMALIQVGWNLNAAFTFIAVVYVRYIQTSCTYNTTTGGNYSYCSSGDGGTAWSGFGFWYTIISFYWTAQVIRNIAHFTTAGTVSSWWLVAEIKTPTWGAFKRASTSSLGTIAVGSLLVAVLDFVQSLARYGGGCVCGCLCGWIKRAVRWFNRYAFIVSAMYGKTYFESAKHVSSLMGAKFWELLVNDTLTGSVFWMGNWMGGLTAAIVGGIWAHNTLDRNNGSGSGMTYLLSFLCFLIGFNVASLFMAVMDSAVSTTLVVWAEDPQSMHRNRPEQHDLIAAAAQKAYPTEFAVVFVPVQPAPYAPGSAGLPYHQQPPANFNPHAPPQY